MSYLLPNLPPLPCPDPHQPAYLNPIGQYFDPEWVKEARELRRSEMTKPPFKLEASDDDNTELNLLNWEDDVVMYSL